MIKSSAYPVGLRLCHGIGKSRCRQFAWNLCFQRRSIHHTSHQLINEGGNDSISKTDAEKRLEKQSKFQDLSGAFEESRHIHMKESETEQNDTLHLGSMLYRESGHTHSHAANQSNPLLKLSRREFKKNPGVRITWIGLWINVGLALGKFTGAIMFHSQALIADSVHALSDLVSDFLTLASVKLSSKQPTAEYPGGYGKIETLGSLSVSAILVFAGLSIGWSSLCAIAAPLLPHVVLDALSSFSHSHSHGAPADVANINAAWIAGGSIVIKEWIFNATKKVAIETNSNVLLANAWHHRVDSLTSLVALVTISSGYFFNIQSLDAVGGLLVSALVVKAGADGMIGAMKELVDRAVSGDDPRYVTVKDNTKEILRKLISNNNAKKPYGLKSLTVLSSGPEMHAKMTLEVPLQRWENVLTIKEFEIVTDHLRKTLRENIPTLRNIDIDYVEERPPLSPEQLKEIENQKKLGQFPIPQNESASSGPLPSGHTHSHFGLGSGHTHKH
ncbi:LAQU0S08e03224g1_1 [Lachancea quebecensis]|uniref:LAQU0S08e03224g1_1 n=1 Tax=Lachancea quebecensis TaxID=1654605 RepID=A0A0P1KSL5_9SACH|nr:LAQU0S08e03224g1_1 [Lachancea quebecensis]